MKDPNCVFCNSPETEIIAETDLSMAFYDKYPVNPGHVLIVPKRHAVTFFEASWEEVMDITKLVYQVKDILQEKFNPDGYNIGFNVGQAAGQTVFHLHLHVIPRYTGDVFEQWCGIRNIMENMVTYPKGDCQD